MGRRGVTYEQVASTAKALVERGIRPSVKAVRDELDTGSYCTIHMHLDRWWREEAPGERAAVAQSVRDDLRGSVELVERLIGELKKLSAVSSLEDRRRMRRHILALHKTLSFLGELGRRVFNEEAP